MECDTYPYYSCFQFRIKDLNNTNPERTITVLGSLENCKNAESMISQKLRVSYESDMAQFIPVIV